MKRSRKRRTQIIPIIIGGIAALVILVLMLGGQGSVQETTMKRNSPDLVDKRVVNALEENDMNALYLEMSPSITDIFSLDALISAEKQTIDRDGRVISIEVLEPITIKADSPWNGEWAESKIRIIREGSTDNFIVRYSLEDNQWWFFGSLEIE